MISRLIRLRVVLETSFWIAAYRAEIAANCLDLFEMVVPRGVEAEIRHQQAGTTTREYPYATLFRHLRGQLTDPPDDAPAALPSFGRGEAEAIPLALQMGAGLLINEYRGWRYAQGAGVQVITAPTVVVTLRTLDIISDSAARRKLELLKPITTREFIVDAQRALDAR